MTSTVVFQVVLLVILAALAGYTIPTLIQLRRTARVVEDMVRDVQPRVLSATVNLDSVLGRTDRVMEGVESGARGISGVITGLGSFMGGLKAPARGVPKGPATMAALANFITGAWQTWVVFSETDGAGSGKDKSGRGVKAPPPDGDGGSSNVQ